MVDCGAKIWLDGKLADLEKAGSVSILAHTLHYGVGAFEGLRAYRSEHGDTHVFRLREHIQRLLDSCKLVLLEPNVGREALLDGCVEVLRQNALPEAYIRPLVWLDAGSMGLSPRDNPVRTAILAWKWDTYLGAAGLAQGIRCKVSSYTRPHLGLGFARGKLTGLYVGSVLAKREAELGGYEEAILLDLGGRVAEASGANVFIVKDGRLSTPPISASILPGITRDTLLTLAREEGLVAVEEDFSRDALILADEVFLTGTAAEVTPVREVDDRRIGDGRVGPITQSLQRRYFEVVRGTNGDHPEWLTRV
jgi:branched-chain amino acid aminotransferase